MKRLCRAILGISLFVTTACDGSGFSDPSKDEALARACDLGNVAEVRRLIVAGADVNNRNTRYARRRTPLALAVHGRHTVIIELLEKAGAKEW